MAYKFEDRFVRFRWDDSLKGKKVFYADSIHCLEKDVVDTDTDSRALGMLTNGLNLLLMCT